MNIKKNFRYFVPVSIKKGLKFIYYSCQDFYNFITKNHPEGYPPKRLNFVGSNEFKKVGDEFVQYFKDIVDLKSSDTVLDIGSGIGRISIPLSKYLINGEIFGFDIDKRGVNWCQKNLTSKNPRLHFEYVDIYNKYYNKNGKIKASEFVFPYEDNKFDFIFATSVFTHMLPDEVTNYLSEIHRVLKPGGKYFLTWFSIDEEAKQNIENQTANCNFIYPDETNVALYSHKSVPEAEIGFSDAWIKDQLNKAKLGANLNVLYGNWANRKTSLSYQDIFIGQKEV